MAMCLNPQYLMEYSIPGNTAIYKMTFATRDRADHFIEGLPQDYIAVAYPVTADGKPMFDLRKTERRMTDGS